MSFKYLVRSFVYFASLSPDELASHDKNIQTALENAQRQIKNSKAMIATHAGLIRGIENDKIVKEAEKEAYLEENDRQIQNLDKDILGYEHQKKHYEQLVKAAGEEKNHLEKNQGALLFLKHGGEKKGFYNASIEEVRACVELPNALAVVLLGVRELVAKLRILKALSFENREDFMSLKEEFFVSRQHGETKDEMQDRVARYIRISATDMHAVS
jgi:hypothetical protein